MTKLEEIVNNAEGETKEAMLELVHSLAEKIRENNRQSQHIDYFKHEIKLLKRKIFGSSSEKIRDPGYQDDFFNEFELCSAELELEELDLPDTPATPKPKKKPGRKALPKTLPRVVVEHDLSDEEKICTCCSHEMECIGKKSSEELDYQPAKFTVIENQRKQYACKSCNKEKQDAEKAAIIKTAKKPEKIIPKSIATASLLAAIIVSKFADHLPLYRLERIFKRESIDLTRQTMSQWVIKVSDAIIPLVNLLQDNVLDYDASFADETTLQVLKEPGRRAQTKSYIWCFVGGPAGRRSVLYQYHPTRKAEAAEQFFEGYSGAIHCDGYSGYHQLISSEQVTGLNCMAHARRKFVEALSNGKEKGVSVVQLRSFEHFTGLSLS